MNKGGRVSAVVLQRLVLLGGAALLVGNGLTACGTRSPASREGAATRQDAAAGGRPVASGGVKEPGDADASVGGSAGWTGVGGASGGTPPVATGGGTTEGDAGMDPFFLAPCERDEECGSTGLECKCGICTAECESYNCWPRILDATCRLRRVYFPGCDGADALRLCTRDCTSDKDCGLEHLVCRDGTCAPRAVARDVEDARFRECAGEHLSLFEKAGALRACKADSDCVHVTGDLPGPTDCTERSAAAVTTTQSDWDALAITASDLDAACQIEAPLLCRATPSAVPACVQGVCTLPPFAPDAAGGCRWPSPKPCHDCLCNKCMMEHFECVAAWGIGCGDAARCVRRTGCTSLSDCYRPDTCMWVFDALGSPFAQAAVTGVSFGLCMNACPAECLGATGL